MPHHEDDDHAGGYDEPEDELATRRRAKLNPDMVQDVLDFHEKFGQHVNSAPGWAPFEVMRMRFNLVAEEYKELHNAVGMGTVEDAVDAAADLMYVTIGLMNAMGADMRLIWAAVHRANMAKEGGPTRDDGKILKPEGWTPPDIKALLDIQPSLRRNG